MQLTRARRACGMELSPRVPATWVLGLVLLAAVAVSQADTSGFYSQTCPQATSIVKEMVLTIIEENPNMAGGFLRLHFHDCFIRGCDASILLNSPTNKAEKDSPANFGTARGFEEIDRIKAALEAECPGIVSCADILALATHDAVVKVGGVSWPLALGRKDGFVSIDSETNQLPAPSSTFDQLVQNFAAKGFNQEEMVVLSGAHTIGRASCGTMQQRLYSFGGVEGATDPSIDHAFAEKLKKECPQKHEGTISMDPTKDTFDTLYFTAVLENKGLFQSDANLLTNPVGRELVTRYSTAGSSFYTDFAAAMLKVSNLGFSNEGEVRRVCSSVNN